MKKDAWFYLIIFAIAFVTFALVVSKNEAVRNTFMQASAEIDLLLKPIFDMAEIKKI